MAKVELQKTEIRISIPKFEQNNTFIIREAYCSQLIYDTDAKTVKVLFTVQHFSTLEDGTKGDYLGYVIPDYQRQITATNDTMCDILTGVPLEADADGNYIGDYTGQYDFFAYIGENQPILIHQFIRNFGMLTDWSKK